MELEILQVQGCPSVPVLEERIAEAIKWAPVEVSIVHRVIESEADAIATGMAGSPTMLMWGRDPFAGPDSAPSMSCRLYSDGQGGIGGAPTVNQLRAAFQLGAAEVVATAAGRAATCFPQPPGDGSPISALREARDAARPSDAVELAVHHAILRGFAVHGAPPAPDQLNAIAAGFGETADQVLARLHASDVIQLDSDGCIQSSYPFSAKPTAHRVQIAAGAHAYSMCAVDALGMSAMLDGVDVAIDSADPTTGSPIKVVVRDTVATAVPETVVVFVGAESMAGPSADICCNYLNFFTDRPSAQAWMAAHPTVGGTIATLSEATACGVAIFGNLLGSRVNNS